MPAEENQAQRAAAPEESPGASAAPARPGNHLKASRPAWLRAALLAGVGYFLIGRGFALPATDVTFWRVAAWVVSGGAYAAHIAYEHYRLGNAPRVSAAHIALGVALGAILLAVAGMLSSLFNTAEIRLTWLLALVVWPAVTAIPAFVGAYVAGAVLARLPRRAAAR